MHMELPENARKLLAFTVGLTLFLWLKGFKIYAFDDPTGKKQKRSNYKCVLFFFFKCYIYKSAERINWSVNQVEPTDKSGEIF